MCSGAFGRLECSSDHMMQLMQVMLRESNPPRCRDVTFLTVQVADMDNANIELEDANTQLEASTNAAEQRCAALEQEIQKLHTAQANLKVIADVFMLCIALPPMHHSLPHTGRLYPQLSVVHHLAYFQW